MKNRNFKKQFKAIKTILRKEQEERHAGLDWAKWGLSREEVVENVDNYNKKGIIRRLNV